MKAQNTRINREQEAVNRIMDLYEQVLRTGRNDTDYRAKLLQELLKLQKEDGSFSVISNYRVDMDIRVAYVYEPNSSHDVHPDLRSVPYERAGTNSFAARFVFC